jgi:protoporphyrinogen/coproporphyrinogen III oxidase
VIHDVVIVGAGIAGLAAAWELKSHGLQPLVVEGSDRAGGIIVSERVDGFVIDGGPDSILVQKPAAVDLCRELKIDNRLVQTLPPRTAYVLKHRELVPLPEASFLGLPTSIRSFIGTRLFSWPAKLRMAVEPFQAAEQSLVDESIGSFMRRRFGREVARYLAAPLLAGIHAGDVDELSVHALFPRLVEAEREHGSVLRALVRSKRSRVPQGRFVSFPGGMEELVEALVLQLGPHVVRCRTSVSRIQSGVTFGVELAGGDTVTARTVIVATPAWEAARLVQGVDRELASLCANIAYASSVTVVFGFRRSDVAHPLAGTGFVVAPTENIRLMAATWVSSKWPERAPRDQVLIRAFLGGVHGPDVVAMSDGDIETLARRELTAVLDIKGQPTMTRVYRWRRSTPQYVVGHLERIRQIDARLSLVPGLYLTGSGYRGTGIADCVADARATAQKAAAFPDILKGQNPFQ